MLEFILSSNRRRGTMEKRINHAVPWIYPFAVHDTPDDGLTIDAAGGKGASLIRLARLGYPVPEGFLITTQAYRLFVSANGIEERIQERLRDQDEEDIQVLEGLSQDIRSFFSRGVIPGELAIEISAAYRHMGEPAVAVRSSATAEDLPGMSFAGQQETYLNVLGEDQLLKAVVNCWSSLWTARAIGYRRRNQVSNSGIALAVVVQKMVESQASGVLFTANPLTGLRTETVIDATLGLGEALVSGQVEPDHYVVNTSDDRIVTKRIGEKATSIHSRAGGGTSVYEQDRKDIQALPDDQIRGLARLGQRVSAEYGYPQDIEWAFAGDQLFLVQSRPITSLFPAPESLPAEPLKVFFSFAAVQGMLDPVTPLGRDAIRLIFAAGGSLFGVELTPETQTVVYTAGERLWMNITTPIRNSVGRRVIHGALGLVEPTARQALTAIWNEPALLPERGGIRLKSLFRIARFALPLAGNILLNILSPKSRREYILRSGEEVLDEMQDRCARVSGDRYTKLSQQVELLPGLLRVHFPRTLLLYVSGVASGMASFNFLRILSGQLSQERDSFNPASQNDLVLEATRGLPYNPTTEMDLALWQAAQTIRGEPEALNEFKKYPADVLARRYQDGLLPPGMAESIQQFLRKYGGRGLGEIDLGRPRWREDPTHVFEMLSGYMLIDQVEKAPDQVFNRSRESAQKAIDHIITKLAARPHGWLKARLARFFAGRVRELMGIRESPKFFMVRMMGFVRQEILRTGIEFVQTGELDRPDDLMFLTFAELKSLASQEKRDCRSLIAERRNAYQRELLRRQIPRILLSDGRAFYEGIASPVGSEGLTGSPVSPGSVEGLVRIVFDPRQAHLLPGEILVCPGTDPSWTPLFLTAAGLIMEVGGMMTHGAVVAREYGIPAVVGVDKATTRLKTGQRISLNGSTGEIIFR